MTTTTSPFRALPERPSIEQLRNQAKDLFRAHKQADRSVCATLRRLRRLEGHSDEQILGAALTLSDVQFALAMDYGLGSWPELKYKVELLRGERTLGTVRREGEHVAIEGLPKIGFAISGRCSYAGALAAALAVTKQPYTYDQIMAYSGLAFRVRWFRSRERPDWCPSSAVGEFPLELQAVSEATGWLQKATARWDADAAMTDLLPAIERSIDRGVPVLGYPSLDNLDLGIIYGYEPDAEQRKLRWLDYRSAGELLLGADKLGNLLIFLERQGLVPDPRAALIAALRSDNWRCRERAAPRPDGVYHYGAQAIATWRDDLAQVAEFDQAARQKLGFVSWFCFAALVDARSAAASFLNQAAEDFEDEIAAGLRQAAAHYGGACGAMLPAVRDRNAFLPPWGDPGLVAWTDAVRAREREILAEVLSWDERAHAALDLALAAARAGDRDAAR